MPTEIILSFTEGPKPNVISRFNGVEDDIAIDNDVFDDDHDFLIEARNFPELLIQLQNKNNPNSVSYEIYGSIDPASTAPAFSSTSWALLDNATGDISGEDNDILRTVISMIWIFIRLKRTTVSLDTIAKIAVTSGRLI